SVTTRKVYTSSRDLFFAVSSDGEMHILAGRVGGGVFISDDYGMTWRQALGDIKIAEIELIVGSDGSVTDVSRADLEALPTRKTATSPLISLAMIAGLLFLLAKFGGQLLHLPHLKDFFRDTLLILAQCAASALGPDRTVRILGMLLTFGAFVL